MHIDDYIIQLENCIDITIKMLYNMYIKPQLSRKRYTKKAASQKLTALFLYFSYYCAVGFCRLKRRFHNEKNASDLAVFD